VLLLAASSVANNEKVRAEIDRVARLLIPHARGERMRLGVCLEPSLALDYALAHVCLRRLGYPDRDFDALIRLSLQSQARGGRERLPHRVLEQELTMRLWEGIKLPNAKRRQRTRSAVNQPLDLMSASRDDIYAFTHALMYVTGFKLCPQRLPRQRAAILAEAEGALCRSLDEQDYDLSGELLLAWPLTGATWSAGAAFAFQVLTSVEDQAGFLVGPGTRLDRLNKLRGNDRTRYLLATAYHTAYVMGLLCAAALASPCSLEPQSTSGDRRIKADPILAIVDATDQHTHWRQELNKLSECERDTLAAFLFNIAINRAVKRRDFNAVASLLNLGYGLGVAGTPVASQAAEMLERLAALSSWQSAGSTSTSSTITEVN